MHLLISIQMDCNQRPKIKKHQSYYTGTGQGFQGFWKKIKVLKKSSVTCSKKCTLPEGILLNASKYLNGFALDFFKTQLALSTVAKVEVILIIKELLHLACILRALEHTDYKKSLHSQHHGCSGIGLRILALAQVGMHQFLLC